MSVQPSKQVNTHTCQTHIHIHAHIHLTHLSLCFGSPVALAHSMDDQKRPTAADHYANDTLSESPERAAT